MPLHVFERRYRVLIQALMDLPDGAHASNSGSSPSGSGRGRARAAPDLHAVGCTAELREVTPYADGRFDIVAVGHRGSACAGWTRGRDAVPHRAGGLPRRAGRRGRTSAELAEHGGAAVRRLPRPAAGGAVRGADRPAGAVVPRRGGGRPRPARAAGAAGAARPRRRGCRPSSTLLRRETRLLDAFRSRCRPSTSPASNPMRTERGDPLIGDCSLIAGGMEGRR